MKPERSFFLVTGGMVVAMAAIFFLFAYGKEHPVDTNHRRMEVLEAAIIGFAGQNKRLPATLAELDVPPENLTDHIGEPYIYTPDTLTVTLTSYGADKKPGGWMFTRDYTEEFPNPLER
jgi:hypothetical protein